MSEVDLFGANLIFLWHNICIVAAKTSRYEDIYTYFNRTYYDYRRM